MGRPIKSKYFVNNDNTPVPGSSISSIALSGNVQGYTPGTITVTISAHDLPEGANATAYGTANAAGWLSNVTVTNAGDGYNQTPTVTTTGSAVLTPTLAQSAGTLGKKLALTAWIPTGSSAKEADIVKQESSRRYRVITADGKGTVRLTNVAPTAGFASLIATDTNGSTYYVTKLTAHKALLTQMTVNGSFVFESDTSQKWTLSAARSGVVSIASE